MPLFVAVATPSFDVPLVMTSPDGITWSLRNSTFPLGWTGIAWSPALRLFAAVAGDTGAAHKVMTSPDGITWTPRTAPGDKQWTRVVWSPDLSLFVAVSNDGSGSGQVMTSPDGITWTAREAAGPRSWEAIAWSPALALFAAVASDGTAAQQIMTSPDGATWTARAAPSARSWQAIAWSPALALFAAVAYDGTAAQQIMTSPDGTTWTPRTSPLVRRWGGIAWSPELALFVAVAANSTGTSNVMTSTNGTTWLSQTTPAASVNWNAITWSPALQLFVAVSEWVSGTTGSQVMTSPDGGVWTLRNTPPANTGQSWNSVAWAPGGATTTTLTSSSNPASVGTAITFTATVTGTAVDAPIGTVVFTADGNIIGTGIIAAGVARLALSNLSAGQYTIVAHYNGDASNLASASSELTQQVVPGATTTSIVASANPAISATSVTITITVSGTGGGPIPGGTITITDGGTFLVALTLSNGSAVYSTTTFSVGTHALVATYGGDTSNTSSNASLSLVVNTAPTTPAAIVILGPSQFNIVRGVAGVTFGVGSLVGYNNGYRLADTHNKVPASFVSLATVAAAPAGFLAEVPVAQRCYLAMTGVTFKPGEPIYLGAAGNLSHTPEELNQVVGIGVSPSICWIDLTPAPDTDSRDVSTIIERHDTTVALLGELRSELMRLRSSVQVMADHDDRGGTDIIP